MVQTQFEYDFVSGDIAAFLRYKYYGASQSFTLSAFDTLSFKPLSSSSLDFERVRGVNGLLRRSLSLDARLLLLGEVDRLTFSKVHQNPDNQRTNVILKGGFQYGIGDDEKSNRISGDPTERIRRLFSAYRTIGAGGRSFSAALTLGTPAGDFAYLKAEGEGIQVLDLGGPRLVGRLHVGLFPWRPYGPPDESSIEKPFQIPGAEFFHLDGRDALKGAKTTERGVNEVHLTGEGFFPVFESRDISFSRVSLNNFHAVGYLGFGNVGDTGAVFTRLHDYRADVGVGFEASFSYRRYKIFISALAARVIQESGSPRFLLSARSLN